MERRAQRKLGIERQSLDEYSGSRASGTDDMAARLHFAD
jgi:hypothetical protein